MKIENSITSVIGGFYGDEGKGKIITSILKRINSKGEFFFSKIANKEILGYCVRSNGGPNGGHSLTINNKKVTGHILPSTILNDNFLSIIGAGCCMDPKGIISEINDFKNNNFFAGILKIDDRCEIILNAYRVLDGMRSGKKSTGSGISDVYSYKAKRLGIKARDLLNSKRLLEKLEDLIPFLKLEFKFLLTKNNKIKTFGALSDKNKEIYNKFVLENSIENQFEILSNYGKKLEEYISNEIANELRDATSRNKIILNESSQSFFLSIDCGIEYGTSSSINPNWLFVSQGLPSKNQNVELIIKALGSRVGDAYFVGEFFDRNKLLSKDDLLKSLGFDENAKREVYEEKAISMMQSNEKEIKANGINLFYNEYGETTKRPRGKAPLDLVALRTLFQQNANNTNNNVRLWINQVDGLEHFKKIQLITKYIDEDGNEYNTIPSFCDEKLRKLNPVFLEIDSWENKLNSDFNLWEENAKNYLKIISKETGFKIAGVGIGPNDEDLIFIDKKF